MGHHNLLGEPLSKLTGPCEQSLLWITDRTWREVQGFGCASFEAVKTAYDPRGGWPSKIGPVFILNVKGVCLESVTYRIKRVVTLNGPRYYVFRSDGRMCGWSETMDGAQEIIPKDTSTALHDFDESRTP